MRSTNPRGRVPATEPGAEGANPPRNLSGTQDRAGETPLESDARASADGESRAVMFDLAG
jgi:hypothetical protein